MWYGINATVIIGPGFIHRAGHGPFLIPHPPLVNSILRYGLDREAKNKLSTTHEFAHLKTTPFAVVYTVMVFYTAYSNRGIPGWETVLFLLLSSHAAWEMISEAITILDDKKGYTRIYTGVPAGARLVFWAITSALVLSGWYIIL